MNGTDSPEDGTSHWSECKGSSLTDSGGRAGRQQFGLASCGDPTRAVSPVLAVVLSNSMADLGVSRNWGCLMQSK